MSEYKIKLKDGIAIIISIVAIVISIVSASIQSKELNLSEVANELQSWARSNEEQANNLNSVLVNNSNTELEIFKKQVSFEIVQDLYDEFYHFGSLNYEIIKKLDRAAKERKNKGYISENNKIQNTDNLLLYLNSFEILYDQCKKGLLTYEDVRMNFMHLINMTCNNPQIDTLTKQGYNGLLLLCSYEHPSSLLGKRANTFQNSCKK